MIDAECEAPKAGRKMMGLPLPTHKLISRVAALRGQSMSDALYVVFREELLRQETGDAWALAPSPFSIKPTYTDRGCEVLLWHPAIPTVTLNRKEASKLAEAIHRAAEANAATDGPISSFKLKAEAQGFNVKVTRGGRCIHLSVNGDNANMIAPTAIDVADALISASVDAGPIPTGAPT